MSSAEWRPGPRVPRPDGVEIATWDLGGAGPPLILMHATGFHARMWLPLAGQLATAHRVWAVDQRGHGASGHNPAGTYREWSQFADDLLAVIDALELATTPGTLTGAGHSLGGCVLLLAEQRRPGTFRSLYCYEPIVLTPEQRTDMSKGPITLSHLARKRRATFGSRSDALANYAPKPPFSQFTPAALNAYVDHAFLDLPDGTVRLACQPEEEASVYEGASLTRAWEGLPDTKSAVTFAGSTEPDGPALLLEDLADRMPDGHARRYAHLTHFGPMEDPIGIGAAIVDAVGSAD